MLGLVGLAGFITYRYTDATARFKPIEIFSKNFRPKLKAEGGLSKE